MSLNVQKVNNLGFQTLNFKPQTKYDPERFVQNSYAVKNDVNHPECRTDEVGQNVYYLA